MMRSLIAALAALLLSAPAWAADWTATGYYQFPDQATADALFQQLGGTPNPDGSLPVGNENYTLVCGITEGSRRPTYNDDGTVADPGDTWPGYWCMGRMNREWAGYAAATAALAPYDKTSEAIGTPAAPRQPWNVYQ